MLHTLQHIALVGQVCVYALCVCMLDNSRLPDILAQGSQKVSLIFKFLPPALPGAQ